MEKQDVQIIPTLHRAVAKAKEGIKCLQESSKDFRALGLISQAEFQHIRDSTNEVGEQMEDLLDLPPLSASKAVFTSPMQTTRKTPMFQNSAATPPSSPRGKLCPRKLTYPLHNKVVGRKVNIFFVDPDIDPDVDQNTLTMKDLKSYSGIVKAVRKHNKRSHLIHYQTGEKVWENMVYLKRHGLVTFEEA